MLPSRHSRALVRRALPIPTSSSSRNATIHLISAAVALYPQLRSPTSWSSIRSIAAAMGGMYALRRVCLHLRNRYEAARQALLRRKRQRGGSGGVKKNKMPRKKKYGNEYEGMGVGQRTRVREVEVGYEESQRQRQQWVDWEDVRHEDRRGSCRVHLGDIPARESLSEARKQQRAHVEERCIEGRYVQDRQKLPDYGLQSYDPHPRNSAVQPSGMASSNHTNNPRALPYRQTPQPLPDTKINFYMKQETPSPKKNTTKPTKARFRSAPMLSKVVKVKMPKANSGGAGTRDRKHIFNMAAIKEVIDALAVTEQAAGQHVTLQDLSVFCRRTPTSAQSAAPLLDIIKTERDGKEAALFQMNGIRDVLDEISPRNA